MVLRYRSNGDKRLSDLHVRNIDRSLLIAINVSSAKEGMTQRDWIIRALTRESAEEIMAGDSTTSSAPVLGRENVGASPTPSAARRKITPAGMTNSEMMRYKREHPEEF